MRCPPVVQQLDDRSCGVCCVKSNLIYWKKDDQIELFERKLVPDENGVAAHRVEAVYRRHGWLVAAGSMTTADLASYTGRGIAVQCITKYDDCGHYVLVFYCGPRRVKYMCPLRGIVSQKTRDFVTEWNSVATDYGVLFPCYGIASYLKQPEP